MTRTHIQRLTGSTKALVLGLLVAALLSATMMLATTKPAHADTTFTVNNTADPGNGVCSSLNGCALREAITAANNTPGTDTIRFNVPDTSTIPGPEVKTIRPTSDLPTITDRVTIDGYSQPGSSPNTLTTGTNAQLKIELDGSSAGFFSSGLSFSSRASNSIVKGLVVNRFGDEGIEILNQASGVSIEGNFIGTDPLGTLDLGNADDGVLIDNGASNTVGGTTPGKRNVISGNNGDGVSIFGGSRGNLVQGNLIGTQKDGTGPLGNGDDGLGISSADDNFVGGAFPDANTLAFNAGDGIEVSGADSTGNDIAINSIFSNDGLGIDLVGGTQSASGATKNDPGDADTGPNGLQNKPVITSATTSGSTTTIQAKLNSTSREALSVRFFSNPTGNEGKTFIGADTFFTNSNGNVTFTFVPVPAVAAGQRITATATDVIDGNTSEFSAPRTVVTQ